MHILSVIRYGCYEINANHGVILIRGINMFQITEGTSLVARESGNNYSMKLLNVSKIVR